MDSTSEVSSMLGEMSAVSVVTSMSISVVTPAEPAGFEGICAASEYRTSVYVDAVDALPDLRVDLENNEDERQNAPADDEQRGKRSCLLIKLLCSFRAPSEF